MTYKWISQGMKMLVIYLDCPAGWDGAEIKAESQGSIFLMHRMTDFLPRADAGAAAAEFLLLLWPWGMELRAAFEFTTTLLWCAHCACTGGLMEKSAGEYLRYWNNSLFFQTLDTRKGWESWGKAAWKKRRIWGDHEKQSCEQGETSKALKVFEPGEFFLSKSVKDRSYAF